MNSSIIFFSDQTSKSLYVPCWYRRPTVKPIEDIKKIPIKHKYTLSLHSEGTILNSVILAVLLFYVLRYLVKFKTSNT